MTIPGWHYLLLADGSTLPGGFTLDSETRFWVVVVMIILATFITEDMTSITVGILIGQGKISLTAGLTGCFAGIFIGDFGLWFLGWLLGRHILHYQWVQRFFPEERLERWRRWFRQYGWATVVGSRFLPGTRIPAFVGAGLVGGNMGLFLLWIALAGLVWTPLIVFLSMWFGATIAEVFGHSWWTLLMAVVMVLLVVHHLVLLFTGEGRCRLKARFSRLVRWEFWPPWLFYLPLAPWLIWLAIRYRGATVLTASNPGIPAGGVVGESKADILDQLPGAWVLSYTLIDGESPETALAAVDETMDEHGWSYPLVFKPDRAQRGVGVKLVKSREEAACYLSKLHRDVQVQAYHPGPGEAGIFYYRLPGEEQGHIFSITDKVFPEVVGDGESTLRRLIWRHPRYRMQAKTFLTRHADDDERVLAAGERFRLAMAGNHCQGTMFRDGAHLITPALLQRIDEIARCYEGFYIGRFDVRYQDVDAFMAGQDLAIVELNGASAESTNLYDTERFHLWQAYGILFRQWELVFRIGAQNRDRGAPTTGVVELARMIRQHYHQRSISTISD